MGRICSRLSRRSGRRRGRGMSGSSAVADSWAVMALLRKEGAADEMMRRLLRRAQHGSLRMLMCPINLGEVYYTMYKRSGELAAERALEAVRQLPIEIVPVKEPLVMDAARLKARFSFSY